jgi:uncharacterized protein YktA (UPF0223 family)
MYNKGIKTKEMATMKEFFLDVEQMYKRACEIAEYGEKSDLFYVSPSSEKMASTWKAWYHLNVDIKGYCDGEIEQAVFEMLKMPRETRYGFMVIDETENSVVLASDRELDRGVDDLTYSDSYERWEKVV